VYSNKIFTAYAEIHGEAAWKSPAKFDRHVIDQPRTCPQPWIDLSHWLTCSLLCYYRSKCIEARSPMEFWLECKPFFCSRNMVRKFTSKNWLVSSTPDCSMYLQRSPNRANLQEIYFMSQLDGKWMCYLYNPSILCFTRILVVLI